MRIQAACRVGLLAVLLVGRVAAGKTDEFDPVGREAVSASRADTEPRESWLDGRRVRLTASTGIDFSSGDYGGPVRSDILSVPFGLKLEVDPFILRVSVPYLLIDGPVAFVGDSPEPTDPTSDFVRSVSNRGSIGDVVVAASYVFLPTSSALPVVELTGKVKFGTASTRKSLGTGETDYTLELDVSKSFGALTPFAGFGYKFVGDIQGLEPFRDKWFASGGASFRVASWLNVGTAYDWRQSSVRGRRDSHELVPFGTIKLGRHVRLDPYAVVGLSQNAPDWGAGLQLRFILERD